MSKTTPGLPADPAIVKAQAKRLRSALASTLPLSHGQALELVAKTHGRRSWGALNAELKGEDPLAGPFNLGYPRTRDYEVLPYTTGLWTSRDLSLLKTALLRKRRANRDAEHRRMVRNLLRDEGLLVNFLPDLLFAISKPLGDMAWCEDPLDLVRINQIQPPKGVFRPTSDEERAMGFDWLPLAAVARILIRLEKIGFDTCPEPLVSQVNEKLEANPQRTQILDVELDCLWYDRERNRERWILLQARDAEGVTSVRKEVLRLADGDVMVPRYDDADRLVHLSIFSPNQYREEMGDMDWDCEET